LARLPGSEEIRALQIEYLRNRKFGEGGSVSPERAKELTERAKSMTISLAELYDIPANFINRLTELDDDDLEAEYQKEQIVEKAKNLAQRTKRSDYLAEDPAYNADLVHWCRQDFWNYDEASALSLAKNPEMLTFDRANGRRFDSALAKEFLERRETAFRAVSYGAIGRTSNPRNWLKWFDSKEFSVPDRLRELITKQGILSAHASQISPSTHSTKTEENANLSAQLEELTKKLAKVEKELDEAKRDVTGKARSSLLKIVLGLAIADLGYDPKAAKSPTAAEIAKLLGGVGIEIEADTVRKYLAEAADAVSYIRPQDL